MTASDTDEARVNTAFDAAIHEMERIENEMSEWKEVTPVSRLNQKAGKEPVSLPQELFNVISAAQKISELSDGAFDEIDEVKKLCFLKSLVWLLVLAQLRKAMQLTRPCRYWSTQV